MSTLSARWRWLGVGIALVLIALLIAPTAIGSKWVYEPWIRRLESGDFRVEVKSVKLRWFSPMVLSELVIADARGPELLRIGEVRTDRGLLASLIGGRRLGRLELIEPRIEIDLLTDGSNLSRLIDSLEGRLGGDTAVDRNGKKPLAVDLDVHVEDLTVRVRQGGAEKPLIVIPPIDVAVAYRGADGPSKLRVEPTRLLNEVTLTPELMRMGLGYAIPLLAKSTWFEGRISMETGAVEIPLDDPLRATGLAIITLHEVRSGPEEPVMIQILDLVAQLRDRPPQHEFVFVDRSQLEIRMADQRVTHSGLKVGVPKVDPRLQLESTGSVGLADRSLELLIDVPVPLEQLARRDEVRELGVPTMKLPIRGSLDAPRVEWSALRGEGADLLGLIRSRIADEAPGTAALLGGLENLAEGQADAAIGAAIDLFREFRKGRQAKKGANASEKEVLPESSDDAPVPANRPILDALKKLLRDGEPQK